MVFVDFSNPFLRRLFPRWLEAHQRRLTSLRGLVAELAASARLDEEVEARAEARPPRPLAAVLDIDEVLLCNTHLNGFTAEAGLQGPGPVDFHVADFFTDRGTGKTWGRADTGDPALPGAHELLQEVVAQGVRPFFVTGRLESIRSTTVEDFRRSGFVGAADSPLEARELEEGPASALRMCPDAGAPPPGQSIRPFKEGQRAEIEKEWRIVFNVGDQISDLGMHSGLQVFLPHPFYRTA
jgi:predicted secreted acid phosphatase